MLVKDYTALIDYNNDFRAKFIASSMNYSLDQNIKDWNEFNLLCNLVEKVSWELQTMVDYQWLCDIVADLYYDCGYDIRDAEQTITLEKWEGGTIERPKILTKEDLENQDYLVVDFIISVYVDKYYDY